MKKKIKKYIRKGFKDIEGWYSQTALELISELNTIQISKDIAGSLCEIGVHHGRSFVLLSLLSQPDEMCIGIDLFEEQDENIENSGCGDEDIVLSNLELYECEISRIKLISKNSLNLTSRELLDTSQQKFRLYSLDGGHSTNIVQNDLQLAESVLRDGGIIIVDDYFDEKWPGVSEGTLRHLLLSGSKLIPFAIFDDKILFTNNHNLKSVYLNELRELVPKYIIKKTLYLGEACIVIYTSPGKLKNFLRKTKLWQSIKTNKFGAQIRSILKK
jgi:hypothetical protein